MFDIGFWEIFLILVLALIVIGPERLPAAARTAGYWVGRARRFIEGVKSDVEQEFDVSEVKRLMRNQEVQINELQRKLSSAGDLSGDDQEQHSYELFDEVIDEEGNNTLVKVDAETLDNADSYNDVDNSDVDNSDNQEADALDKNVEGKA